jgi:hypothetical protein
MIKQKMNMAFTIHPSIKYTPPPIKIQSSTNIQSLAYSNTTVTGNIFQSIYNTGPCSSCGK